MTSAEDYAEALDKLFRRRAVATVDDLRRVLGVTSRTTVSKALQKAGYLSSYSHAGRFYTLRRYPTFDENGLWFHGEVRFSSHGTLRTTVVVLVKQSPAGYTHEELQALLGLRVHDTLRSLVESQLLARDLFGAVYVYLHPDPQVASVQLARREERSTSVPAEAAKPLDLTRVVDVLVAVIQAPKDDAKGIAARLKVRGIDVSAEQVEEVLARYGIVKKTARSTLRRSRH